MVTPELNLSGEPTDIHQKIEVKWDDNERVPGLELRLGGSTYKAAFVDG